MSVDMSQFHGVFFEESHEHLREMEHLLLEFSADEPDREALDSIFRAAHSIKGGSGIFGFDALTGLTHVMEDILDKARSEKIQLTADIIDILLSSADQLTGILNAYQQNGEIDWDGIEQGIQKLEAVNPSSETATSDEQGFGFFTSTETAHIDEDFGFFDEAPPPKPVKEESFGFFEPLESETNATALQSTKNTSDTPAPEDHQTADSSLKNTAAPANKESSKAKAQQTPGKKSTTEAKGAPESKTIRVDTAKIDALINLVGELVITQSVLRLAKHEAEGQMLETLEVAIEGLARNTRDIQESVMSMRMLPVSFVFNRFPRMIRDLSSKLDKKISLDIQGETTEIDKGMVEKLVDPLTHLVRNSVDHGIESHQQRLESGKSAQGTVTLTAEQQGGNVFITIRDDGAGLDRERILNKAKVNGMPVSDNMPDKEVWKLIFEPGFSTAEEVTDVSGRGVGMDVVRRNIEAINGSIDIDSTKGLGSSIKIRLPLTMAILDGMCVSVGEQTFIIPLTNITESMQPKSDQISTIGNDRVLRVRERYWPIVALHELMQIPPKNSQATEAILVLVETSQRRFALQVDSLDGQQQVVIKSLERHYRKVDNVAGATIMGDGKVALIVDVEAIAQSVQQTRQVECENE